MSVPHVTANGCAAFAAFTEVDYALILTAILGVNQDLYNPTMSPFCSSSSTLSRFVPTSPPLRQRIQNTETRLVLSFQFFYEYFANDNLSPEDLLVVENAIMKSTTFAAALVAIAPVAFAADIPVKVGQTGLVFDPTTVTAAVGDVIHFQFAGGNHVRSPYPERGRTCTYTSVSLQTATQSPFAAPCTRLFNDDTKTPGFDSGLYVLLALGHGGTLSLMTCVFFQHTNRGSYLHRERHEPSLVLLRPSCPLQRRHGLRYQPTGKRKHLRHLPGQCRFR